MPAGRFKGVYVIGVVKSLTGLSERQIRYYEEQGLIRPQRTAGNQRLYSQAHLERLLRIKLLLSRGLSLEQVRSCLERAGTAEERWIEVFRGQVWDKSLRVRADSLRDIGSIRVLVKYRLHHPPAIDRLYRGGPPGIGALPALPIRLYPLHDPAAVRLVRLWSGQHRDVATEGGAGSWRQPVEPRNDASRSWRPSGGTASVR